MFPLNDLRPDNRRDRALAALVNYPVPLLVVAGIAVHRPWSLWIALSLCVLAVAGHVASWWLPYFGVSAAARESARTLKIPPTEGRDVVIDDHVAG